jgi:glycerate 2-kinase
MERGFAKAFPNLDVVKVPVADGGEGTVEALVTATNGKILREKVMGPIGDEVDAHWGILGDGTTAVIEMAAASGLPLVPVDKRDPRFTTTFGTGQLIKAALERGLRRIIIGIGGSATNDGGTGMARALGVKFLDSSKHELTQGGAALANLDSVDITALDPRINKTEIIVACDVDNPLCGPRGASAVYGPQKGATPEIVTELDAALAHYSDVTSKTVDKHISEKPGAGAAGGLGAGLMFFTPAILKPGVEIVLEATHFEDLAKKADFIVTGEGRTDFQTVFGKAPVGVAAVAKKHGKIVVCLSGGLGQGANDVLDHGIDAVMSVVPGPMSLEECMESAEDLIESAAFRLARMLIAGKSLPR